MTKAEMIARLRAEYPILKNVEEAHAMIDSVFGLVVIGLGVAEGDRKRSMRVRGLGVFYATVKPKRIGRHPRTGEPMTIPAKIGLSFKPGAGIAEAIDMPLVPPKPVKASKGSAKRVAGVAAGAASVR